MGDGCVNVYKQRKRGSNMDITKEEYRLLYGAVMCADLGTQIKREPLRECIELLDRINAEVNDVEK